MMAHTAHIAPLDLTPTGHLPAFVAEAAERVQLAAEATRERADQLAAEPAHDRAGDPDIDTILNQVEAHLPHVDPDLAEHGRRALTFARASRHLTREQMELTYDEDLGGHRTTPIETPMRDIDDQHTDEENAVVPLFSVEVVVTDWKALPPVEAGGRFVSGGSVDGRFTEMWFRHGDTTGTVTPAKAREIAAEMRSFAARLDALCDVADEIAADDFQLDPEASRLKREELDRRIRAVNEASE